MDEVNYIHISLPPIIVDMFLNKKQMLNDFIRVGFCGLIMAIFLVLFNYLELFILITLATIIYLLALFITRTVDKEDIEIIRKIRG